MTKPTESHLPYSPASKWREANKAAILSSNAWVEANGLPMQDYRLF